MKQIGVGLLIIIVMIWINNRLNEGVIMPNETIKIILDEDEKDYRERFMDGFSLDTHKTGLKYYKIRLEESNHVELVVGDSSVTFDYPLSVNIVIDEVRKVNNFDFSLGLSPADTMTSEEARDVIYKILKQLTDAGWKRYISGSYVRISGAEVIKHKKNSRLSGTPDLDEKYFLSWEEWFSMPNYLWSFYYKDKGFVTVRLLREGVSRSFMQKDGFFLSIEVESVENSLRNNVRVLEGEKREDWKELWLKGMERTKNFRLKNEEEAIKAGYHIDYTFEDAPKVRGIFDLSNESNQSDENVTCTHTGYWQSYIDSSEPLQGLSKREGTIFFYQAGMVFLEKDEELNKYHELLRWRFLGTKDEYNLSDGKLIKKVENEEGKKVSMFSEGDICPKNGYWEAYLHQEKGSKGVAYFTKGEQLSTNSKEPLAILFKWKYLGDENDFEVLGGKLVRRG